MYYRYRKLVLVLLISFRLFGTATAESWLEIPFTITPLSEPEGSQVTWSATGLQFSATGAYTLSLDPIETDQGVALDPQIALTVQSTAPITLQVTLRSGPTGGQVALEQDRLRFSSPGEYVLQVTATPAEAVQWLDDQLTLNIKSADQVEAELAAITGATPFIETATSADMAAHHLFLPLVASAEGGATATEPTPMSMEAAHAATMNMEAAHAATMTAGSFGAFDKNKVPVELQAWWTPAFGHIHLAALVPFAQPVSGKISLPIRVVFHDNPSVLRYLSVHTDEKALLRVPLGDLRCPQGVCAWAFTITIDTTQMSSGWRELRLRAEAQTPDGNRFLNSSGIPILVQNGGTVKNYSQFCNHTGLIGRGWYENFGYTNAIIECVPTAPVKGLVTFRVRAQQPSQHLRVDLDKSHYIPAVGLWPQQDDSAGAALFDKDGNFSSSGDWISLPIDTKKLANGWHALAVQSTGPKGAMSQCSGCPTTTSFPAGLAKIWFYVQN